MATSPRKKIPVVSSVSPTPFALFLPPLPEREKFFTKRKKTQTNKEKPSEPIRKNKTPLKTIYKQKKTPLPIANCTPLTQRDLVSALTVTN